MLEKDIQTQILATLGKRTDMRVWRQNTGAVKIGGRFIRFGLKGQADISGILADGRRLEIECKTKNGRLSDDQKAFGDMITKYGGLYVVARSVEQVLAAIDG